MREGGKGRAGPRGGGRGGEIAFGVDDGEGMATTHEGKEEGGVRRRHARKGGFLKLVVDVGC